MEQAMQERKMTTLIDFPEELLLTIATKLHEDTHALAMLSRVSRLFARIVKTQLYHSISIGQNPQKSGDIVLLVRTILENPRLVPFVKKLHLTAHCYHNREPRTRMIASFLESMEKSSQGSLNARCIHWLRPFMQPYVNNDYLTKTADLFSAHLTKNVETAYAGFILLRLQDVEELDIRVLQGNSFHNPAYKALEKLFSIPLVPVRMGHHQYTDFFGKHLWNRDIVTRLSTFGTNLDMLQLGFPNLRYLNVTLVGLKGYWGVRLVQNEMITMEKLKLEQLHTLAVTTSLATLENSRMSTLPLQQRVSSLGYLLQLLSDSKLLTLHIFLDLTPNWQRSDRTNLHNLDFLIQDMGCAIDVLEELEVKAANNRAVKWMRKFRAFEPVTLLARLKRLRRLIIPADTLIDRDYFKHTYGKIDLSNTLPDSLKELVIVSPGANALAWFEDLWAQQAFKHIQSITLSCTRDWGETSRWFYNNDRMLNELRNIGIDVRVTEVHAGREAYGNSMWEEWADEDWGIGLFGSS